MQKVKSILNIGLVGGGVVGGGVCEILNRINCSVDLNIKTICVQNIEKKRDFSVPKTCKLINNSDDIINDPEIDVVVELMGGTTKAKEIIFSAINKGKHLITYSGNKALISKYLIELDELLSSHPNVYFGFEASVAGGIPIIQSIQQNFKGDKINSINGIINGSTNYMLTKMSQDNISYTECLSIARELGYLEADPSADVEGYDARSKLIILARLAYGIQLREDDVYTQGISKISNLDINYARENNMTIKLLGSTVNNNGEITSSITPTLIHNSNILSSIDMENNIVEIKSNNLGSSSYIGKGAGRFPTANSVVNDLFRVIEGYREPAFPRLEKDFVINRDIRSQWYIRYSKQNNVELKIPIEILNERYLYIY